MTLTEKIENEIKNISNEKQFIEMYAKKFQTHELDEIELRGLALTTTAIYNGIERTLEYLLEYKKVSVPKNDSWHIQLLNKSFESKLLSQELFSELKSFLSFRHFVRHAYTFELKKESIETIIQKVPALTAGFIETVKVVIEQY